MSDASSEKFFSTAAVKGTGRFSLYPAENVVNVMAQVHCHSAGVYCHAEICLGAVIAMPVCGHFF